MTACLPCLGKGHLEFPAAALESQLIPSHLPRAGAFSAPMFSFLSLKAMSQMEIKPPQWRFDAGTCLPIASLLL